MADKGNQFQRRSKLLIGILLWIVSKYPIRLRELKIAVVFLEMCPIRPMPYISSLNAHPLCQAHTIVSVITFSLDRREDVPHLLRCTESSWNLIFSSQLKTYRNGRGVFNGLPRPLDGRWKESMSRVSH